MRRGYNCERFAGALGEDRKERNGGTVDSGSQKVQHYLDMISHIFDSRLLIIGITNENSSDLERVAATRSKSDEFSFGGTKFWY